MVCSKKGLALSVGSVVVYFVMNSAVLSAQAADQVHVCDRYGNGSWISEDAPELALGFLKPCTEGTPTPVAAPPLTPYQPSPVAIERPQLEVGRYYLTPYMDVVKVLGIVQPASFKGRSFFLIEYVSATGGICGYLGYWSIDRQWPIYSETAPQDIPEGCPVASQNTVNTQ